MKTTEKLIEAVRAMRCLDAMGRDLVEAPEEHRPAIQARIDSIHRAAEEALHAASRSKAPIKAGPSRQVVLLCSVCEHVFRVNDGGSDTTDPEAPVCGECVEGRERLKRREAETRARETAELAVDVRRERRKDAVAEDPFMAIGGAS